MTQIPLLLRGFRNPYLIFHPRSLSTPTHSLSTENISLRWTTKLRPLLAVWPRWPSSDRSSPTTLLDTEPFFARAHRSPFFADLSAEPCCATQSAMFFSKVFPFLVIVSSIWWCFLFLVFCSYKLYYEIGKRAKIHVYTYIFAIHENPIQVWSRWIRFFSYMLFFV